MSTTIKTTCPGELSVSTPPSRKTLKNCQASVLVADDHADSRFLFRTMLELRGIDVVEADNGEMALALATNVRIDMILLDSDLPVLDGYAATSRLRNNVTTQALTIVIVSTHSESTAKVKALASGCNEFLVKPFGFRDLDWLLQHYLFKKQMVKANTESLSAVR